MNKLFSFDEFANRVGVEVVLEANRHLNKVSEILGLKFDILIFEQDSEYLIKEDDRTIISIDKILLFVRPYEFFRVKALCTFNDYEETTKEQFGMTRFYDSLIQLQMKENIGLFMYYYLIYIFDYFNLEAEESKLSKLKDGTIIFDSAKYEWVYKDIDKKDVQYQKVLHVIRVSEETDEIRISKIYTGHRFQTINIKIADIL